MAEVLKEPSQIYSADGDLLQTIAAEYRDPVPIDEIPDTVINATIAAEDERFYGHNGVDFIAVARVAKELLTGATQTGGSTITMQIAKRVYTSPEQTLSRKFDDMALAIQLERTLTKNQILELYLNQIFYGRRAYGIKAAADVYFGKTLEELTIAEAALLARCVRRPTYENPVTNSEIALSNRDVVLKLMKQNSLISQEEYDEALAEPLKLRHARSPAAQRAADVAWARSDRPQRRRISHRNHHQPRISADR
jgi:penicillin-binding protein 1A